MMSRLNHQVKEMVLMETKDMNTPEQEPNPNAFWCPKCCGHTDSAERETYVGDSQGGSGKTYVDSCVSCDAVGGIPAKQYKSIIWGTTIIVLCVTTFAAIMVTCFPEKESTSTWNAIITFCVNTLSLTLFLSPGILFAWVVTCGSTFLRYRKWRKWVKEHS